MCLETSEKFIRVKAIVVEEADNVATVLDEVEENCIVDVYNKKNELLCQVKALEGIPKGNKIALKKLKVDESVIKYKNIIGKTTRSIEKGMLVHVHNVKSLLIDTPRSTIYEVLKIMNLDNKMEEIDE